jgi:transcriptional regulator with XRE-family HTH domain
MKATSTSIIGDRIRTVRERKGVTLKALAEKAGVSESLVSQIERNRVSPSLDTLLAIIAALEIDLDWLFRDLKRNKQVTIVRSGERRVTRAGGIEFQHLSVMRDGSEEHAVVACYLTMEPGTETGDTEYGHIGRELGVIVNGKAVLSYGIETYELDEGDSVSFSSEIPHKLRNAGESALVALWITIPPRR